MDRIVEEYKRVINNYTVDTFLESIADNLDQVEIFYDYVDGEEGDAYKYEYYSEGNLVAVEENFGGDRVDIDLTRYGKELFLNHHVEILSKIFKED